MFDRLAPRYDFFNLLTGMGMAPIWRKKSLAFLRQGMSVLDIGCGTGDLSIEASRMVGASGRVTAIDFSEVMLEHARQRPKGPAPIRWEAMKAEDLPIKGEVFDAVVSGFVLRNLYQNIDRILAGAYDSLKPGGRISFLDFTEPQSTFLKGLWHFYMNTAAALYGKLLFGKNYPDFYLTDSAQRFAKPLEFKKKLAAAGFKNAEARFMMLGVIVLYEAAK